MFEAILMGLAILPLAFFAGVILTLTWPIWAVLTLFYLFGGG